MIMSENSLRRRIKGKLPEECPLLQTCGELVEESWFQYRCCSKDWICCLAPKVREASEHHRKPRELSRKMPEEEKPYAGGVLSTLMGGKPELLISDIEMRNPNKRELIINRDLRSRDWVFEVKVINIGKTPVSHVGVLLAVGDERLDTIIEDTLEYNMGAAALVYVRPSAKMLSGESVEINAVVDPRNDYKENNEENNLFTKTFKLKRH